MTNYERDPEGYIQPVVIWRGHFYSYDTPTPCLTLTEIIEVAQEEFPQVSFDKLLVSVDKDSQNAHTFNLAMAPKREDDEF